LTDTLTCKWSCLIIPALHSIFETQISHSRIRIDSDRKRGKIWVMINWEWRETTKIGKYDSWFTNNALKQ
jgi:hypothetical protein